MSAWTPELASGGQLYPCAKCGLPPTPEGHDGCLGEIASNDHGGIMNACCGHGDDRLAYIQYNDGFTIRGSKAIEEQRK